MLSNRGQCQVFSREALQALRLGLLAPDHVVSGHVGALIAQYPGQHLFGGYWFGCLVVGRLRVRVVVRVDVEAVGLAASRGHDVEHFAGGGRRDQRVRGVNRAPLSTMGARGVGELDVLGNVGDRKDHHPAADRPLHSHASTLLRGCDNPPVSVAHPTLSGRKTPVVLAGHHQVTDAGGSSAGHRQPVSGHRTGGDPVSPGTGVELADGTEVTGDHQAGLAGLGVGFPGQVKGVEHLVPVALGDPLMGLVGVDGVGGPGPQLDAGPLLPGVMKAAHVGQLGGASLAVAHQCGEHAPGIDRAELGLVTNQDDLGPGHRGGAHELIQSEGPGQRGLVHDHQLVRPEAPPAHLVHGGVDALAQRRAGSRDVGK